MKSRLLIGIDIGTSATKTALYDECGTRLAVHTAEYPLYQPQNGWAEQEPEDWWQATLAGICAVLSASHCDPRDIVGIGLSGQMHGLVMLNEQGQVLRRSIIWCDGRTSEECEDITRLVGAERLMDITKSPALTGFTASKILWVRKHEPEIYNKCRHILLPKDYIRYRLTDVFATDASDASGMQLLDIAKRDWSDEVLTALDIDRALLADVYESCQVTGHITPEIAKLTGLDEQTIVVGGAGDNAAAAVGCGAVRDGRGLPPSAPAALYSAIASSFAPIPTVAFIPSVPPCRVNTTSWASRSRQAYLCVGSGINSLPSSKSRQVNGTSTFTLAWMRSPPTFPLARIACCSCPI